MKNKTVDAPLAITNEQGVTWSSIIIVILILIIAGGVFWYFTRGGENQTVNDTVVIENGSSSDEELGVIKFSFTNLAPLSSGHYEVWLELDSDEKKSLGSFQINENRELMDLGGNTIKGNSFKTPDLGERTIEKVFVSVEPNDDSDEASSAIVVLSGNMSQNIANLSFNAVRLGNASGKYVLATPTNDPLETETSGAWFFIPGAVTERPSLVIPELTSGWKYEGWVFHQGEFLSTGRFSKARGSDDFSSYSDDASSAPSFPGEDFLKNPPHGFGFDFPINLADGNSMVLITIEPDIDGADPTGNSPFMIQPFISKISKDAKDHELFDLTKDLSRFPTGLVEIL
ncbi:MAG TPA: anti-sigma factor [Patescibacteria group bacterium]|nr:anti-sigma factor [Patescibacteria group bacterium]